MTTRKKFSFVKRILLLFSLHHENHVKKNIVTSLCYYYYYSISAPSILEVVRQILRHHFLRIYYYFPLLIVCYSKNKQKNIAKKNNNSLFKRRTESWICTFFFIIPANARKNCNPISKKACSIMERQRLATQILWITLHLSDIFTSTVTRHWSSSLFHFTHLWIISKINNSTTQSKAKSSSQPKAKIL